MGGKLFDGGVDVEAADENNEVEGQTERAEPVLPAFALCWRSSPRCRRRSCGRGDSDVELGGDQRSERGYSLGLYRFVDAELVAPDVDVVRAVLAPWGFVPGKPAADSIDFWIRTDDGGEASLSVSSSMVGVERPASGKIRGVIAELADGVGAGVLTPRGTFLFREDSRGHLPEGMENDSVFVPEITREALEDVGNVGSEPA